MRTTTIDEVWQRLLDLGEQPGTPEQRREYNRLLGQSEYLLGEFLKLQAPIADLKAAMVGATFDGPVGDLMKAQLSNPGTVGKY